MEKGQTVYTPRSNSHISGTVESTEGDIVTIICEKGSKSMYHKSIVFTNLKDLYNYLIDRTNKKLDQCEMNRKAFKQKLIFLDKKVRELG